MADDDIGGDWKQSIELTRAEFIALKEHLASLRGIEAPGNGT